MDDAAFDQRRGSRRSHLGTGRGAHLWAGLAARVFAGLAPGLVASLVPGLVAVVLISTASPARAALTRPPRLLRFVEAEYPPAALAAGTTATVTLALDLTATGTVASATVTTSAGPDFERSAIQAARQLVFAPAEVDGAPAPVRILFRYRFAVHLESTARGPPVDLEGQVKERFQRRPLAGVRVTIRDLGTSTVTDAAGRFAFAGLPPGTHPVEVSGDRLISVTTEETILPGKKTRVWYLVETREEGIDEEEVVRAPRVRRESTEVTLQAEEGRRVPGTQGDTLKVVQNLPGVARASVGSGQLVVWGAAPADTRVYVDGIEVPALYHLGGLRSTLDSDLVQSIQLIPGAYGAEHGRGLGGLVLVETRQLPRDPGVHGHVSADVLDASLLLTAAPSAQLRIAAAGRYSYLDRVLAGVVASDVGEIFPIPRYDDAQLIATLDLRKDEALTLLFMASNDRLTRTLDAADPRAVRRQRQGLDFYRASLAYTRLLPGGASLAVTPAVVDEVSDQESDFGRVPAELRVEALHYGVRSSYRERVAPGATLSVGLDAWGTRARVHRAGSITLPPREGDIAVFGQPPGDDVNSDNFHADVVDVAPFAFLELTAGPVSITPGLRLEACAIDAQRRYPPVLGSPEIGTSRVSVAIDPRIEVRWPLTANLTLSAAAGIYHQPPAPADLSAIFGAPALDLSRAIHAMLGGALRVAATTTAELTGFYEDLGDLVARSRLPTPMSGQALTQLGSGRTFGAQALLRQQLAGGVFGWLSYTLSRSDRQDAPDAPVRLFDFDQTHVLSLVASWEIERWVLGGRLRYASGFPRTPVVGAFFDVRDDVYQPIFGAQNAVRLPAFFQLDLRVERSFPLGFGTFRAYLDAQNVTYRSNPEELVYRYDFSRRGFITGLPFLAVAGARLEF